MLASAVDPVRNPSGGIISHGVKLMNFLKGPKQVTPLLHGLISVSGKMVIAVRDDLWAEEEVCKIKDMNPLW